MSDFLKWMLRLIVMVWGIMACWVYILHFPWHWVWYAVIGVEVLMAIMTFAMESQAEEVQGAGGWMSFAFVILNVHFAWLLGLARLLVWVYQKYWA